MTLFLHIGIGKTGTTTLQVFLEQHHQTLAERGIHVARAPQSRNHRALATHALDDGFLENSRKAKGLTTPERLDAFRKDLEARIDAEAAVVPGDSALVFTSEQLTRLSRPSEFARLKTLLTPYGREIKIIVYLRRQDKYFVSEYSQKIKGGQDIDMIVGQDILGPQSERSVYDYEQFLSRWADAFGDENIIVRPFEPAQLADRDVIADFAQIIGLTDHADLDHPPRQNESLDRHTIAYLRRLNAHVPRFIDGRVNKNRTALIALLESISDDQTIRLDSQQAQAIQNRFAASNAAVARRFMGREDGALFLEPLGDQVSISQTLDLDKSFEITGRLLSKLNIGKLRL